MYYIYLWRIKTYLLTYHDSNLSLTARKTRQLLFDHQLTPFAIQPKSISLEQICYERS